MPLLRALWTRIVRSIVLAVEGFVKDGCTNSATVLTFYTLLNVVPIIAVVFAIAKGFGLEKLVKKQVIELAEKGNWQPGVTEQIIGFAQSLLEHAKGGVIAGIGIVFLFWTIISILGKIEESFNTIWDVRHPRTMVRKFSDYLTMMILAPLFFILSSSATILISSEIEIIMSKIALLGAMRPVIVVFLNFLPYLSIWALLTLLYLVIPNTKVPILSGLLGGCVAGTIYQIVQWVYINFQIGVAKYGAIYGSFAAIPLFLVWLQLSWMIVLFGAEISYAGNRIETFGYHPDYRRTGIATRRFMAMRVFYAILKRFSVGEKPCNAEQISQSLEIPIQYVREIIHDLGDVGIIAEVAREGRGEAGYQPARSIENLTIKAFIDIYEKQDMMELKENLPDALAIGHYLREIANAAETSPGNVKLEEVENKTKQ